MMEHLLPRLVMDHVTIDLQNCYGIKKLQWQFDFSKETIYAIYAPNGFMKSSLANTFSDLAKGAATVDRIFAARTTIRSIKDEAGKDLPPNSVFVVCPYDAAFGPTERTSTLLVNAVLKKEYDQLLSGVEDAKDALLKVLKKQTGSKKDLEAEISSTFTSTDAEFMAALARISKEVEQLQDTPFATVEYDTVFDDKVLTALDTKDAKTAIENYVQRYNELLAASLFFRKGTFDYYNAGQIAESLTKNGFFAAKHTVTLKSNGKSKEISTQRELEAIIEQEKEGILTDAKLRKQFDDLASMLKKNVTLRDFQTYMMDHEDYLSQLSNVRKFKENIWKSCLKVNFDLYQDLMAKQAAVATRVAEIRAQAAKESTLWQMVIDIFNSRFQVPFTIDAKNKIPVMLGDEPMVELGFTYHDANDHAVVEQAKLKDILSMGERKALYILNIIFEVEVRKKDKQETLMVIDDLADSFDYQNKYAIIQYLRDINEDRLFKQIIMTHNFDFFRVMNSRFVRQNCLMASKTSAGLTLESAEGFVQNPFVKVWKGKLFKNNKCKIAAIPFVRNLLEFTIGSSDPNYKKLTSLLHWKTDTATLTVAHLDTIYNAVFTTTDASANGKDLLIDLFQKEADLCRTAGAGINLENKIVMSIAIRLFAEKFMVGKINDAKLWASIKYNQTWILLSEFKKRFPNDAATIRVLDRVNLMTPENIHLNSFMYEPILDMSDEHLRTLWDEILVLK
jgi:ABC-type cobalamin/Fe3+-siderophores transport system ATPase subunit